MNAFIAKLFTGLAGTIFSYVLLIIKTLDVFMSPVVVTSLAGRETALQKHCV
jgi:hypothetical protein